jgi:MFS family permease
MLLVPLVEKSITVFGWRSSYLILAGAVLFLLVPLNLVLSRHRPEDLNLHPDGDETDPTREPVQHAMIMKVVDMDWASRQWTFSTAVKTRRFWCLVGAFFFGAYVYQGTLLHAVSAMVDAGLGRDMGAFYFGIAGVGGACGKILFGYLSDFLGRERVGTFAGFLAAMGIVCLIDVARAPTAMPVLFGLLFGLGYGAVAPLFPSVTADIFLGRSFGLIFCMVAIGGGLGGSCGPLVSGFLRDVSGSYSLPFTLFFVSLFLSYLLLWLAGPRKVRRMVKSSSLRTATG